MVTVVPIPRNAGSAFDSSTIWMSASRSADWNCTSTRCAPALSASKNHLNVLSMNCSIARTTSSLARSPAL